MVSAIRYVATAAPLAVHSVSVAELKVTSSVVRVSSNVVPSSC